MLATTHTIRCAGLHGVHPLQAQPAIAGGRNEFIWQAWAHLEAKQNNVSQARKVG